MKIYLKKYFSSDNFHKGFILFLYIAISAYLFPFYRYIIYPDGVAFMATAQNYRDGNFFYAINQSWGPLYSWILAFYSLIFKDFVVSGKVLNLSIGLVIIFIIIKLSSKIGLTQKYSYLVGYFAIPGVIFFALANGIIADLLFTLIFLFYLLVVLDFNEKNTYLYGLFGGLLYLTKQYGFFLFLFHFCLIFFYYFYSQRRIKLFYLFIKNILVFFIICFLWSSLLFLKYHHLTLGAQQKYNLALVGPESKGHPLLHNGLYPTGRGNIFSIWEDFSTIEIKSWNPFSSLSDFKLLINNIITNSKELLFQYQSFSIFSASILLLSFLVASFSKEKKNRKALILIFSLIFYPLGYLPIMVNDRYLWVSYFLLLILAIYLSEKLFYSNLFVKKNLLNKAIVIIIFSLSFIKYPVKHLMARVYQDKNIYELSQSLTQTINLENFSLASDTDFNKSLVLSYYLKVKYYGALKEEQSIYKEKEELKKYKISYLLLWNSAKKDQNYGKKIYENKKYSLKIVKIQP